MCICEVGNIFHLRNKGDKLDAFSFDWVDLLSPIEVSDGVIVKQLLVSFTFNFSLLDKYYEPEPLSHFGTIHFENAEQRKFRKPSHNLRLKLPLNSPHLSHPAAFNNHNPLNFESSHPYIYVKLLLNLRYHPSRRATFQQFNLPLNSWSPHTRCKPRNKGHPISVHERIENIPAPYHDNHQHSIHSGVNSHATHLVTELDFLEFENLFNGRLRDVNGVLARYSA